MDYSIAERLVLEAFGLVLDIGSAERAHPRAFWGAWTATFLVAAVLMLRRPGRATD